MKYKNKISGKVVTVDKIKDGYVYFRIDGIDTVVAEKRFYKAYEVVK